MDEKSHVGISCFFCGETIGVLLDKRLKKSLPNTPIVINMEPCDKCKKFMEQGIILISIKDSTTAEEMGKGGKLPNPYKTGEWCVVKDDAGFWEIVDSDLSAYAKRHRFMFLTDESWDKLGLPRE